MYGNEPTSLLNNPFSDESTSRNTAVFDGSGRRKAFFNRLLRDAGEAMGQSPTWGTPTARMA
jgi:hypothetical protein